MRWPTSVQDYLLRREMTVYIGRVMGAGSRHCLSSLDQARTDNSPTDENCGKSQNPLNERKQLFSYDNSGDWKIEGMF